MLADKVDIAAKTVRRIEAVDGVPNSTAATLFKIQAAFEQAGIEFVGTPDSAPGIRIHFHPDS